MGPFPAKALDKHLTIITPESKSPLLTEGSSEEWGLFQYKDNTSRCEDSHHKDKNFLDGLIFLMGIPIW